MMRFFQKLFNQHLISIWIIIIILFIFLITLIIINLWNILMNHALD